MDCNAHSPLSRSLHPHPHQLLFPILPSSSSQMGRSGHYTHLALHCTHSGRAWTAGPCKAGSPVVCGLLTLGGTRHTCPCYTTAATRVVVVSSEVQASWFMVQTPLPAYSSPSPSAGAGAGACAGRRCRPGLGLALPYLACVLVYKSELAPTPAAQRHFLPTSPRRLSLREIGD